jgi:tetratricopeptide (TPR) repeat protein
VRAELAGLHGAAAKEVSRHLVVAGRLLDDDPEAAYRHAVAARERASRVPSVREAVGLAAYATGRYADALAELRTVRRLTGSPEHLPVMADCERGLGRPERALELARSDEAKQLDPARRVELLIVAAGARADLGEPEAAVVTLQVPQLRSTAREPWVARLRSAYADALAAVGRSDEAREWLERAAEVDVDGDTGAADRLAELDGEILLDLEEDDLGLGSGGVEGSGGGQGLTGEAEVAGPGDLA